MQPTARNPINEAMFTYFGTLADVNNEYAKKLADLDQRIVLDAIADYGQRYEETRYRPTVFSIRSAVERRIFSEQSHRESLKPRPVPKESDEKAFHVYAKKCLDSLLGRQNGG